MNTKQRKKLLRFIRELSQYRGRHTELVSIYGPQGYDIIKIIQHVQQEQGTASNIKDKTNRNNVIDSLEKIIRHLRLFKKTPDNGLAVFAGNISDKENKTNIQVFSIEPPEPVQLRTYRCDQTFLLDPLKDMIEEKEVYGLIVLDNREGNVGILKGTMIKEIKRLTSDVPGKTTKGGQSQGRYERIREIAAKEFHKKIAEVANKEFLEMKNLKGIIVGGPGPTKETFLDENYLNNELKKKLIGVKDLSYTGDFGLKELVEKSNDILSEQASIKEKELLKRFFTILAKEPRKIVYGKEKTLKALESSAVDILILTDDMDDNFVEEVELRAVDFGTNVEIVSSETQEGNQLKELGGIAGILRFEVY
jgi:peptide chain release factor subunit 1